MTMTIGDLVARFAIDSTDAKKGAHDGGEALRELQESADRVREAFAEVATAVGIGFGIERGAEAIKAQFEEVINLSHVAARTGIEINDLQALKLEAKEAGVEFETLQRGITKLSVAFTEAADGGEEQVKLFQDLKLNVNEL